MNHFHRQIILNNIEKLVEETDFKLLIEKCQETGLLTNEMVKRIYDSSEDDAIRHKNLLLKITQHDSTAFTVFKNICEMNFIEAAIILNQELVEENGKTFLQPNTNISFVDEEKNEENIRLEPYDGPIIREIDVRRATKFCSSSKFETYHMQSQQRGVLFLVNIIDFNGKDKRRNGAEVDKDRLLDLFNQMGFVLYYYENINAGQFRSLIKQLSSSINLITADCLVFGVLSHGDLISQATYVEFCDGLYYETEQIVQEFSNSNCKYLQGKPKVFLFPFCRGTKPDRGVTIYRPRNTQIEHDSSRIEHVPHDRLPMFSDIVICYATVPGFVTHRDPNLGSWYIQGFCKVLAEHAHDTKFEDLMRYLELEVGSKRTACGSMQTSAVEYRRLLKDFYFNPGYFGHNGDETNGNQMLKFIFYNSLFYLIFMIIYFYISL